MRSPVDGSDVQEALEHVDDLFEAVDADGAGLPDEGLPDGVLGGEGGGVGGDGPGPVRGLAALPDDDGLSLADVLENFEEAAAVLDALDVHADHLGLGVLAEVFEVVRDVEDDGVAQAHELADLHPVRAPEQAEVHALGAALADEAYGPGLAGVLLGRESGRRSRG